MIKIFSKKHLNFLKPSNTDQNLHHQPPNRISIPIKLSLKDYFYLEGATRPLSEPDNFSQLPSLKTWDMIWGLHPMNESARSSQFWISNLKIGGDSIMKSGNQIQRSTSYAMMPWVPLDVGIFNSNVIPDKKGKPKWVQIQKIISFDEENDFKLKWKFVF